MVEIPKRVGETLEGEVNVNVGAPSVNPAMGGMMSISVINVGRVNITREAGLWLEKTGFLIKVDKASTLALKG